MIRKDSPRFRQTRFFECNNVIVFYSLLKTCVLGAHKNHLIETFLLSTHSICFDQEMRKMIFNYVLLSRGLIVFIGSSAVKGHQCGFN